jgi:methanogenic corrinoid protein MtbC1
MTSNQLALAGNAQHLAVWKRWLGRYWQVSNEEVPQEVQRMPVSPSGERWPAECLSEAPTPWVPASGSAWRDVADERAGAKDRLGRLAKTLEVDVIPRLVQLHGEQARVHAAPDAAEVERFAQALVASGDEAVKAVVQACRARGLLVGSLFLDLLAPAARLLGSWWDEDKCDFSTVTVALGRLQRLMRELSPAFGQEVHEPPNGRRVLLAQHPGEQHSFGLAMVAEYFRREGWEVLGGIGGSVNDPSSEVAREWFDAAGFSVGSETRVEWVRERIADLRRRSRNKAIAVIVGGPLLSLDPTWAQRLGADASGHQGDQAPLIAHQLISARSVQR